VCAITVDNYTIPMLDSKLCENVRDALQVEWEAFSRLHDNLSPYRLSAELLLFLLQPHARLQRDLEVARARIGWDSMPRPILVLHIRYTTHFELSGVTDLMKLLDLLQHLSCIQGMGRSGRRASGSQPKITYRCRSDSL
jgi:hypothetical protein